MSQAHHYVGVQEHRDFVWETVISASNHRGASGSNMEASVRVVPMVPGMRTRKRENDNDSVSTTGNDSMRPLADVRRTKRRRTILDAFNSISLKVPGTQEEPYNDDADSSRAVAEDDGGYTTNSSLDEEDDESVTDEGGDESMLSDKEVKAVGVERQVMLELVFGPESTFAPPRNPVDQKIDLLIRTSAKKATEDPILGTQDDISLSTAYNGSVSSDSESMSLGAGLKRSNSLPEIYASQMDTVSEEMDFEDE